MYVRIKVWPNTIEYFARAYVYYLNMDQNIATKHTAHANFWTVGEIVVRVCVCFCDVKTSSKRPHSLLLSFYMVQTLWQPQRIPFEMSSASVVSVTALSSKNIAYLYNKMNMLAKKPLSPTTIVP